MMGLVFFHAMLIMLMHFTQGETVMDIGDDLSEMLDSCSFF